MYCDHCEREYPETYEVCPQCGRELSITLPLLVRLMGWIDKDELKYFPRAGSADYIAIWRKVEEVIWLHFDVAFEREFYHRGLVGVVTSRDDPVSRAIEREVIEGWFRENGMEPNPVAVKQVRQFIKNVHPEESVPRPNPLGIILPEELPRKENSSWWKRLLGR
jgi:hypothetical protein